MATVTPLDSRTLLQNHLDDVLRLVEAVWQYVCETGRHKLDWRAIVDKAQLPWTPSQAQAIWRFIAYSWKRDGSDGNASSVCLDASGGLDEAESDLDERASGFRNREQFRQHLLAQRQLLPRTLLPLATPTPLVPVSASVLRPAGTRAEAAADEDDDGGDGDGNIAMPAARRARRAWTTSEDIALLAAVRANGEDAWPAVCKTSQLRRTAEQLAHRYVAIRRRVTKGIYNDAAVSSVRELLSQIDAAAASKSQPQPPVP